MSSFKIVNRAGRFSNLSASTVKASDLSVSGSLTEMDGKTLRMVRAYTPNGEPLSTGVHELVSSPGGSEVVTLPSGAIFERINISSVPNDDTFVPVAGSMRVGVNDGEGGGIASMPFIDSVDIENGTAFNWTRHIGSAGTNGEGDIIIGDDNTLAVNLSTTTIPDGQYLCFDLFYKE